MVWEDKKDAFINSLKWEKKECSLRKECITKIFLRLFERKTDKRHIKIGGLIGDSMLIQKYYPKPLPQNLNLFYLLLCLLIKLCV